MQILDQGIRVLQEGVQRSGTVKVMGTVTSVELVLTEPKIQVSGDSFADASSCQQTVDVNDPGSPGLPNVTIARATTKDAGSRALTRVFAQLASVNSNRARIGVGDISRGIIGNTGVGVVGPQGIGQYAVICGGFERGIVDITAEVGNPVVDSATAALTVVGGPAEVVLTAAPGTILCDGVQTSTVTATVRDIDGALVADGVRVSFNVYVIGVANPINTVTSTGQASSVVM